MVQKYTLIDEEDGWTTVTVDEAPKYKVKRKRLNAAKPPTPKKSGPNNPGRRKYYKFKDDED